MYYYLCVEFKFLKRRYRAWRITIAAYKETLYAQSLVWPLFKMQDAALSNVFFLNVAQNT